MEYGEDGTLGERQKTLAPVAGSPTVDCGVTRLFLSRFRNYEHQDIFLLPLPVVLTGDNGAGKTSVLEALSLFCPGRGLHHVKLSQITHVNKKQNSPQNAASFPPYFPAPYHWTAAIDLDLHDEGCIHMGTGLETTVTGSERRHIKINGIPQKTQGSLTDWLSVTWVTPQMGRLFIDTSSPRRKFIDRMIFAVDNTHADRLHTYEHHLRQRSLLLRTGSADEGWLSILEKKISEDGVALAVARQQMAQTLNASQSRISTNPFPRFDMKMVGELENLLENNAALAVEELFLEKLYQSRRHDALTGGAGIGPHRSDFMLVHLAKDLPAEVCSTGEQKMLLLALILAFAKVQMQQQPRLILLLLDDIIAHLDEQYRTILFQELCAPEIRNSRIQTWMTGTDPRDFNDLRPYAQFFSVSNATLSNG